jgi:hypothetical protein
MSVEFVPAAMVEDLAERVRAARGAVNDAQGGDDEPEGAAYWESLFEANANAVLGVLGRVKLPHGYVVRYRFYTRQGADLLVRPFVARDSTDVTMIRELIDWHPAPDSVAPMLRTQPNRDSDFLYRHFAFERTAAGYYEYWMAMQELWASARWIHSRVIATREEFAALAEQSGWQIEREVEHFEPAVVGDDTQAQLAVLVFCPLERQTVTLHRIEIGADQSIQFVEAIPVARGPRGYLM